MPRRAAWEAKDAVERAKNRVVKEENIVAVKYEVD
jgi:hypothetical protein